MRLGRNERAVFLGFGCVSAQLQGFANLLLRQSLAKTQKSSLRIGYSFSSNALALYCTKGQWIWHQRAIHNGGFLCTIEGKVPAGD
jgi:hypothetical protein